MAKTIIQTIGPLYGEVVNGTVFGRPNGSVFVPAQNTIKVSLESTRRYVRIATSGIYYYYVVCSSSGVITWDNAIKFVAESQDIANYVEIQLSDSADFASYTSRRVSAGTFNAGQTYASGPSSDAYPDIVADQTYYLRAVLMSATGVPVATSDVIEVVGVVA